jgi:YVTN family beta-propeller protein
VTRGERRRSRRRRLRLIVAGVIIVLAGAGTGIFLWVGGDGGTGVHAAGAPSTTVPAVTAPPVTIPTTTTTTIPSTAHALHLVRTITGSIAPKSVAASGTGLVFAQNMMYRHTVTVYDHDGNLVGTIPDSVDLAAFGIAGHPGISRGAPVEAAFTPDGRYAWVTNYAMYGEGFGPEGTDDCSPASRFSESFVYRIDVQSLAIDKVVPVGQVPKYVAVTPDGTRVLVANWCSYDLSVIDAYTGAPLARIPIGRYPRGIVSDPASTVAYVAVMGENAVAVVDLTTLTVSRRILRVGNSPRHLVISPDGKTLYASLNGEGRVVKIDLMTDQVVGKVDTGSEPRSMVAAADGRSLFVVNYAASTVTKLAADDLRVLQTVRTPDHPIGITIDPTTGRVWVACYSSIILVYDDI